MAYYKAGELIRLLRRQRNMTQEKLAKGIMDRGNLARIESGKQVITKEKMDLLMERLGHTASRFFSYALSDNEYAIYEMRDELNESIRSMDTEKADALIAKMETNPVFMEGFHKQFLLSNKAANLINKEGDPEAVRQWLDEAIKISIPNFDEEAISQYLLSSEDIGIINMMAIVYAFQKQNQKSINLLQKLATQIKKQYVDKKEKARLLSLVFCNLSKYLGIEGRREEALAICDEAIKLSIDHHVYHLLPDIIYNKAYNCLQLNRVDECKRLLYQAYYSCDMMNRSPHRELILKLAKEKFDIDIETF